MGKSCTGSLAFLHTDLGLRRLNNGAGWQAIANEMEPPRLDFKNIDISPEIVEMPSVKRLGDLPDGT